MHLDNDLETLNQALNQNNGNGPTDRAPRPAGPHDGPRIITLRQIAAFLIQETQALRDRLAILEPAE